MVEIGLAGAAGAAERLSGDVSSCGFIRLGELPGLTQVQRPRSVMNQYLPLGFERNPSRLALLFVIMGMWLLAGCGTSTAERAARSAEFTSQGNATLENYTRKGLTTERCYVQSVDGEFLTRRSKGVCPLVPGRRTVGIYCQFSRTAIGGLQHASAEWRASFEAKPGVRYQIRGRRVALTKAELTIVELETGAVAAGPQEIDLVINYQTVPIVIPVLGDE